MRKAIIFFTIICFSFITPLYALDQATKQFKDTLDQLQLALIFGDMDYIHAHLSLDSILRAKIKEYSGLVQKQSSFWKRTTAKIVGAGDSLAAKGAAVMVEKEYNKTSKAQRKAYQSNLTIAQYLVKGDLGTASGSFLGKPASLTAKKIKGEWVVVGVDSPLINQEVKRILKIK